MSHCTLPGTAIKLNSPHCSKARRAFFLPSRVIIKVNRITGNSPLGVYSRARKPVNRCAVTLDPNHRFQKAIPARFSPTASRELELERKTQRRYSEREREREKERERLQTRTRRKISSHVVLQLSPTVIRDAPSC